MWGHRNIDMRVWCMLDVEAICESLPSRHSHRISCIEAHDFRSALAYLRSDLCVSDSDSDSNTA